MADRFLDPTITAAGFIEDRCITGPMAGSVRFVDAYIAYLEYMDDKEGSPLSRTDFVRFMESRGHKSMLDPFRWSDGRLTRLALKGVS